MDYTHPHLAFLLNMRQIRIGIKEAEQALSDKNRLDTFCMLLKIKLMFRSSDLNLTSYNKCSAIMHISNTKLKRLLESGCKLGYFRKEQSKAGKIRFIAQKIHSDKEYSYRTRKDDLSKLTFPELKNLVRRIVIENQIRKQEDVFNTHNKGTDGTSMKSIRCARKRESRMLKKSFCTDYRGLSYDRAKKVINSSLYMSMKVLTNLVQRGIVSKKHRISFIEAEPSTCNKNWSFRDEKGIVVMSGRNRKLFAVQSNVYSVAKDNGIGLSNHGRKEGKM